MELDSKNLDFRMLMKNQQTINENILKEKKENMSLFDMKIISFKIGSEYYGIDILNVKEILKESKFTGVPNTLDFVVGVLNLRGDIIPIIDLAKMFHLKEQAAGSENGRVKSIIVLKVEHLLIGVVVEEIQRVIPLRNDDIQPPSPILGTINERYIRGVVEINGNLYVIFDTDAVFSDKGKGKKDVLSQVSELSEEFFIHFCNQIEEFSNIHINEFNKTAFKESFDQFMIGKNLNEMPVLDKAVSADVVKGFFSRHTGEFWQQPFVDQFVDTAGPMLKRFCSEEVRVLVLGCSYGHEAYSVFFALGEYFKEAEIQMVAADQNLAAISSATALETSKSSMPSWFDHKKYFMELSSDTMKIKKEITDKIYFEYHNIKNIGYFTKEFDIIIARDISLYLSQEEYYKFLKNVTDKIISGGLFVIGDNENIARYDVLSKIQNNHINLYQRK